jgi:predicted nucleotidyltransferase
MQAQLEALREVQEFLDQQGIQHLVIGGIANAIWGKPRATRDADFKILPGDRSISEVVDLIGTQFKFRTADPHAFAQRTYVLPIYASNGIEADIGLGFLPYEEQAVARGTPAQHQGVSFLVCTAEDLIIQKAISEREKDWEDIAGVLQRQGQKLDQEYIRQWLLPFAEALNRPELIERYDSLVKRISKSR